MDNKDLVDRIRAAHDNLAALQRAAPAAASEEMAIALQELQNTVEELQVAQEELRQQNEELIATRERVEAERRCYQELFELASDGYVETDLQGVIRQANRAAAALLRAPQDSLPGKPLAVFVPGEERPSFRRQLLQVPQEQKVREWEVRLQPSQGRPFDASLAVGLASGPHRDPGLRWLLRDITPRQKMEKDLRQARAELEGRAEERTAELRVVNTSLQREIAERQQSQEALRESEEKYRQLFAVVPDGIMLFDAETQQFIDVNVAAAELYGYSREEFVQLRQPDITNEPAASVASIQATLAGELTHIPLRHHKKKDGTVFPVEISAGAFTLKNRQLVCGVVRDITARQQAEKQLRLYQRDLRTLAAQLALAEDRERRQIARDLHDQVGQSVALTQMKVEELFEQVAPTPHTSLWDEIHALIKQIGGDVRSLTFELSPPLLYELGLEAALEWLAEQLQAEHGLHIGVASDGQPAPLSDEVRALAFRSVRELLLNVVKHARARTARVTLQRQGDNLHLEVADDGVGFDPVQRNAAARQTAAFGHFSVRERLDFVGGSFEVDAAPGRGTRAVLVIPIASE